MIYPGAPAWAGGAVPRHPTQLYEAFAEGLLLFVIMWQLAEEDSFKDGMMVAFFLLFYAVFRFIIECFKKPDPPPLGYRVRLI